jgi:hypothetical protein
MQGFVRLEAGLVPHARCGPIYGPLFALLLGRDTRAIPMGLAADATALEEFLLVRTVLPRERPCEPYPIPQGCDAVLQPPGGEEVVLYAPDVMMVVLGLVRTLQELVCRRARCAP